jgi:hypothetical protein
MMLSPQEREDGSVVRRTVQLLHVGQRSLNVKAILLRREVVAYPSALWLHPRASVDSLTSPPAIQMVIRTTRMSVAQQRPENRSLESEGLLMTSGAQQAQSRAIRHTTGRLR